eukprot:NODE_4316_length_591_cov_83.483395_g3120_i0.p2 GENE.NODE_4316_length_591_cov_83.483395_g3120_i0~~NODE_4316_length_591_cov_83.483395_g3120_i0.p2  ORF type:complete len:109 (-),score=9.29 NODE_4316_length_591_cov_83.483395_g3120_i0:185-511(-)
MPVACEGDDRWTGHPRIRYPPPSSTVVIRHPRPPKTAGRVPSFDPPADSVSRPTFHHNNARVRMLSSVPGYFFFYYFVFFACCATFRVYLHALLSSPPFLPTLSLVVW